MIPVISLIAVACNSQPVGQQNQIVANPPQAVVMEAILTCLPHKPSAPPTKECGEGVQAVDGKYFDLDWTDLPGGLHEDLQIDINNRVQITGKLYPPTPSNYDVYGVIRLSDIHKLSK